MAPALIHNFITPFPPPDQTRPTSLKIGLCLIKFLRVSCTSLHFPLMGIYIHSPAWSVVFQWLIYFTVLYLVKSHSAELMHPLIWHSSLKPSLISLHACISHALPAECFFHPSVAEDDLFFLRILATRWEWCIIMTRWKSYLTLIVALMVICSLNCSNAVFWLKPIIECVQVIFQPNFRFCIKNILMRMYNIETVGERLFINRLLWMIIANSGNAVRTLHCKQVKILFDFNCGSHGYLCSYKSYGWNM